MKQANSLVQLQYQHSHLAGQTSMGEFLILLHCVMLSAALWKSLLHLFVSKHFPNFCSEVKTMEEAPLTVLCSYFVSLLIEVYSVSFISHSGLDMVLYFSIQRETLLLRNYYH
jgi:hypothetical protein